MKLLNIYKILKEFTKKLLELTIRLARPQDLRDSNSHWRQAKTIHPVNKMSS